MADVVAGDVLAVLDELDRLPEERALVHAGDEPLDHLSGPQIEPADARSTVWVKKRRGSSSIGRQCCHSSSAAAAIGFATTAFACALTHAAKIFLNRSSFSSSPSLCGVSSQQLLDHRVGRDAFGGGGEVRQDAVPQHRQGQRLDVLGLDVRPAVQQRPGLGAEDQVLHGPRAGTPLSQSLMNFGTPGSPTRVCRTRASV